MSQMPGTGLGRPDYIQKITPKGTITTGVVRYNRDFEYKEPSTNQYDSGHRVARQGNFTILEVLKTEILGSGKEPWMNKKEVKAILTKDVTNYVGVAPIIYDGGNKPKSLTKENHASKETLDFVSKTSGIQTELWKIKNRLAEIDFKLYESKGMSQAEKNNLTIERDTLIAKQKALVSQENELYAERNRRFKRNNNLIYIGVGALALTIGYFAYKKLKK
jgi:hypothetical protein